MIEDLLAQMADYMKGMQDNMYLIRCNLEAHNEMNSKYLKQLKTRRNIIKKVSKMFGVFGLGILCGALIVGLIMKYAV